MVVQLKKPELQRFIDEQVKAGRYSSPDAAIEAAVQQMMLEQEGLDDQTLAAINRADEQYDQGQYVEWRDVRDELRKRYLSK